MKQHLAVMAVFLSITGCRTTDILERRIVQARDEQGRVAYYQIEIDGEANIAKSSYKSGLYDAEALDTLFGGVSEGDSAAVSQTLERHRQEAVNKLAGGYYKELENPEARDSVRRAEDRLAVAMRSPYDISSKDEILGLSSPKRKYALILSSKASEIETAIAAIVEEKETTETILTALASVKRRDFINTRVRREELDRKLTALNDMKSRAEALKPLAAGATAQERQAYLQSVNALLREVTGASTP